MAKNKDIQEGGVLLADEWKLYPIDEDLWELCHLHATSKGRDSGVTKWHRCGRFYTHGTVNQALLYVADQLTRAKCYDESLALVQALDQWREVVDALADVMRGAAR